jgi:hypothetical protein
MVMMISITGSLLSLGGMALHHATICQQSALELVQRTAQLDRLHLSLHRDLDETLEVLSRDPPQLLLKHQRICRYTLREGQIERTILSGDQQRLQQCWPIAARSLDFQVNDQPDGRSLARIALSLGPSSSADEPKAANRTMNILWLYRIGTENRP